MLKKLRVEPPETTLVTLYLKEIARTYGVAWNVTPPSTPPPAFDDDDDDEPTTKQKALPLLSEDADPKAAELTQATPPRKITAKSPIHMAPPSPSTDNIHPTIKFPEPPILKPSGKVAGLGNTNTARNPPPRPTPTNTDADDLAARFAALKKR